MVWSAFVSALRRSTETSWEYLSFKPFLRRSFSFSHSFGLVKHWGRWYQINSHRRAARTQKAKPQQKQAFEFVVMVEICLRVSNTTQHDCRMISVLCGCWDRKCTWCSSRSAWERSFPFCTLLKKISILRKAKTSNQNFTFEWLP